MRWYRYFILVCLLVLGSLSVLSDTRLNITMSEIVYQNVTFAQDFYLTEQTTDCRIVGTLNVTNPSSDTVSDIYLNFTQASDFQTNFTWIEGRIGYQVMGSAPGASDSDIFRIHIPELSPGNFSTFEYNLSCATTSPPLDINTTYTNVDHGFNRKVLAGENWTITQEAINRYSLPITNVNITIETQGVTWNGTVFNFSLLRVNRIDDWSSVNNNSDSTEHWWWEPNVGTGTIPAGSSYNITYYVKAPYNVPTSASYMAIKETLEYSISYLASNVSLDEVRAVGAMKFMESKRIVQPADNENSTNVTWEVSLNISVPKNFTYNLEKVSVWITESLNLTDRSTSFGQLNITYRPATTINRTKSWTTPGSDSVWRFNFTDGSDSTTSPAPIVWLKPTFTLTNGYDQIVNSTYTRNGNDLYMKYIYVINGYWLQVDKNITSIDADTYMVKIFVENVGNAWTPEGLDVTVYDFVPKEFTPYSFSKAWQANLTVNSAEFNGTSFRWVVPRQAPYNSSLGPKNGPQAVPLGQRSWNCTYYVNGSGAYSVSELYIVGLDPRKVDGAGTHEGITVLSALNSASGEILYVGIAVFLIVLNVFNFVMTKRINKKLENFK